VGRVVVCVGAYPTCVAYPTYLANSTQE